MSLLQYIVHAKIVIENYLIIFNNSLSIINYKYFLVSFIIATFVMFIQTITYSLKLIYYDNRKKHWGFISR